MKKNLSPIKEETPPDNFGSLHPKIEEIINELQDLEAQKAIIELKLYNSETSFLTNFGGFDKISEVLNGGEVTNFSPSDRIFTSNAISIDNFLDDQNPKSNISIETDLKKDDNNLKSIPKVRKRTKKSDEPPKIRFKL